MSKHKKHIPKSGSFLNKVFSKEQSKEAYTDLEWEAKQGLDQLGEEGAVEALARIHNRIESQKKNTIKKTNCHPLMALCRSRCMCRSSDYHRQSNH